MNTQTVEAKPWELEPWVLAYKVRNYRVSNRITRHEFAGECGISERTLRKIEGSIPVRDLTVVKIYDRFPGVFGGGK